MPPTPSEYVDRAKQIIREAEKSLRGLVAEAATEGDYEAIGKITPSAKEISALAERMVNGKSGAATTRAMSQETGNYPRFFRSSDNRLIMLGWSKKTQTEYEHRAPRIILDQLVSVLLEDGRDGQPIAIDQILPRLTAKNGTLAPKYYGRTYLRWLRAIGLVKKYGHQGYAIASQNDFQSEVNMHWRRLAIR
jgi:hypothetical protein